MKALLTLLFLLPLALVAQDTTTAVADTIIYDIADEKPRFPTPCERYDTTAAAKEQCSERALMAYINQRALYTAEAREQNISGMAVVSFVVEKTGFISMARILRDPGGQLGVSALRSVIGMANEVRWRPAIKDGKPVRFQYVLPVKFRIEERKPYVVAGRDTIYTELTKPLVFTGSDGKLGDYLAEKIKYPESGQDSCLTGQMDIQILVRPDGRVDVQDIIDYNDLGTDFTFETISVVTSSFGQWTPAEYEGKAVTAAYDLSFVFAPTNEACQTTVAAYNDAINAMNEGQVLLQDTTTIDEGLAKMDLAIEAFPADGRFRILRGQARMDNNRLDGACEDLRLAKSIALINWFDGILPLICQGVEE
ncbi:MAG: energy transducer TonB [Bacteroidota bacterium]